MDTQILLVWNRLGTAPTEFFMIPDPPDWLREAHRTYVGDVHDKLAVRIHDALCTHPRYRIGDEDDCIAGTWAHYRIFPNEVYTPESRFSIVVSGVASEVQVGHPKVVDPGSDRVSKLKPLTRVGHKPSGTLHEFEEDEKKK